MHLDLLHAVNPQILSSGPPRAPTLAWCYVCSNNIVKAVEDALAATGTTREATKIEGGIAHPVLSRHHGPIHQWA